MIKNLGGRKLSVTSAHRRSMLRNLAQSLFIHEKIKTTLARAKEVARFSERLITSARPGDMNAKRKVEALTSAQNTVSKYEKLYLKTAEA